MAKKKVVGIFWIQSSATEAHSSLNQICPGQPSLCDGDPPCVSVASPL